MSQKAFVTEGSSPLFDQTFEQQLQRVKEDVEKDWPKFRDANHGFEIVKKELEDLNLEDVGEFLSVYSVLLDFVHQYPHKKDIAHRQSLKQALQTDAYHIIRCIWQDALQNLEPFSRRKPDNDMFLALSTFYSALFRLADNSYGEEEFAQLWLQDLCDRPSVVFVIVHCFFFADEDAVRQHAWKSLELVLSMDRTRYALNDYFKSIIGPQKSLRRFQQLLEMKSMSDDSLLRLFQFHQPFEISNEESQKIWRQAFQKSLEIFTRVYLTQRSAMQYDHIMATLEAPNKLLRSSIATQHTPTSNPLWLSVVEDLVKSPKGMQLVAKSAILLAKTADYFDNAKQQPTAGQKEAFLHNRSKEYSKFSDRIIIVPVILDELTKVKHWKVRHKEFINVLFDHSIPLWKKTFDSLCVLEETGDLPKYDVLPTVLFNWASFGTMLGITRLLNPVPGCCYAKCSAFLVEDEEKPFGRCSGCREVIYCSETCQNMDWKFVHRRYCQTPSM